MYDTLLNAQQQADFNTLRNEYLKQGGRDIYLDKQNYDIQGAFTDGLLDNLLKNNEAHLPDTYKKPNHITFSDQSIYSTQETPGGVWDIVAKQYRYTPSDYVLWQHSPVELREYFRKYEPNSILNIIPNSDWK